MVGTTLNDIRAHIETLASDDGTYVVRCGRTGERPVPVSGLRFDGRTTAHSAARAAAQYRAALRRYDPQVPYYDLIVCEDRGPVVSAVDTRESQLPASREMATERVTGPAESGSEPARRRLVEFCHSTAATVFETLSDEGYDGVETAVMDAYFDLAETCPHDCLCLVLLESMAMELDAGLPPEDQAAVLASAARRLSPADTTANPVSATLSALEDRGLLSGYTRSPWSVDGRDGSRSTVVQLSAYALAPRDGRLPVLPIALELYRHRPEWVPSSFRVGDVGDGWQLTLTAANEATPNGLASARIES